MKLRKTDNSFFETKVFLREAFLPNKKEIRVLDAFAGTGLIWNTIKAKHKNIKITAIEKEKSKHARAIEGDNLKVIPVLDLSLFDIIDLDAYGTTFPQLKEIFKNNSWKNNVVVFTTDIQTFFGKVPNDLLKYANITKRMIGKTPTMFNNFAEKAYENFLYENGVDKYWEIKPEPRKSYKVFYLRKRK